MSRPRFGGNTMDTGFETIDDVVVWTSPLLSELALGLAVAAAITIWVLAGIWRQARLSPEEMGAPLRQTGTSLHPAEHDDIAALDADELSGAFRR
jgi:hypothetical protein